MRRGKEFVLAMALGAACAAAPVSLRAQLLQPGTPSNIPNPLADSTVSLGKMILYKLDARFAKDVAERGGPGFASWFADDGVALNNGKQPIIGKVAIARSATWSPKDYQLTWTPTDAMMSPADDMGYIWGHYVGHSKDANGNPIATSGRYITVWRKQPDGTWKVVLDAGADDAPAAGDCCKIPSGP